MSFTGSVRAASWYPNVKATMDAAGVPEYLWVSIIRSEDPSLNVGQVTADTYADGSSAGNSYGLFQLNQDPQGANPAYAASWAAGKLRPALAALGGTYTPAQALAAAETAAWPGNDAALDAKELPARTAALQSTLAEMGMKSTSPSVPAAGVANAQAASSPSTPSPGFFGPLVDAIGSFGTGISSTVGNAEDTLTSAIATDLETAGRNLLIGAIVLAVIVGGFALVVSNGKAPNIVVA